MRPTRLAMPAFATLLAAFLAGPALAGAAIEVVHPWARPTIPDRPGAVYFGVHNPGEAPDRLIGASTPRAGTVEMHKSEERDGVMTMTPVEAVEIPAGGMAHFGPGGLHLMLFDIDPPLQAGETIDVTLEFEQAGEVAMQVPVTRDAPAGAEAHGHGEGHGAGN